MARLSSIVDLLRARPLGSRSALGLAAAALSAYVAKPRDKGAPHAPRFAKYNEELTQNGKGKPVLLLDLDALDANIAAVRRSLARPDPQQSITPGAVHEPQRDHLEVRIAAKSLPSLPLLRYVLKHLGTNRLMVFDDSISTMARELPDADLLIGKPLPVRAAAAFYEGQKTAPREDRIRWLIDSQARLAQYAGLARSLGKKLCVCIEVDVGLHRGGVPDPAALTPLLQAISANPDHIELSGLMGYDAHVAAAPPLFASRQRAFGTVIERYAAFKDAVRAHNPEWLGGDRVYNGAGSKTYSMYNKDGPLTEVTIGSALVMPADFDVPALTAHTAALFIATPVLKRLSGIQVPYLEWASGPWGFWNPNRRVTYFVFGGGWLAKPVSPAGLIGNPVYGFSTNQALFNGSEKTGLHPDDWIFLRPTQSERVMQEFGSIVTTRGGKLEEEWSVLSF